MNDIELRTFSAEMVAEDEAKKIKGVASVFEKISNNLGGFREIIHYPAFGDLIVKDDVFALKNHDENLILGRNISGTLRLIEDKEGLKFVVDPPDTTYANDLLVSMGRGDIDKCSFAFNVAEGGEWWEEVDGMPLRHVTKMGKLWDISIVTYPGFSQTKAELFGRQIRTPEQVYKEYRSSKTQAQPEPPKRKIIDTLRLKQKLIEK